MKNVLFGLVLLVLTASSARLSASTIADTNQFPEKVIPGTSFTLAGTFDPTKKDAVFKLYLLGTDTKIVKTFSGMVSADGKSVAITLPDKLDPGRYYLTLDYQGVTDNVPGELRVVPDAVQLDSAHPTTAYANGSGSFDFDVVGQNFSSTLLDNNIYIAGQGSIIKNWDTRANCEKALATTVVPATGTGQSQESNLPCLWIDTPNGVQPPDKLHVVGYHAERYQGPLTFKVRVGSVSSVEKQLVLSKMSAAGVLFWSIIIFLALAFIIYRLVARGMKDNIIDGNHYSPFWSFFIDKETNTYSLSKFQLLAFSTVFVFGYLYVFLCSWLVQWHFVLPDVPANFSAILGMSAGTTVAAAGATSARGSKGAGGLLPSAADFITTGGQVVPERFQFFVWTLVACFGFLALLISQNPATIQGFPTFPDGLLYVMGVSAGGYLGGKLTRAAGPVIRNIAWDKDRKEITVQGENLSSDGDFFIDGKKLPIVTDADQTARLVVPTPQEQASDKTFCSQLKITIAPAAALDLTTGEHMFRIVNKDAQFADIRFTADPSAITTVVMADSPVIPAAVPASVDASKLLAHGKSQVVIKVTGSGFRMGTTARWTPANAKDPIDLEASAVEFVDSQNLKITLVPGDPGSGTLMLQTPNGFSAVVTVTVV
jgi:hypothetical protein